MNMAATATNVSSGIVGIGLECGIILAAETGGGGRLRVANDAVGNGN